MEPQIDPYELDDPYYYEKRDRESEGFVIQFVTLIVKGVWKALIFSPLLFTGYLIIKQYLNTQDNYFTWIVAIIFVAFLLYMIIVQIKRFIATQYAKGNYLIWLPLLIICVVFTCILPAYLIYDTVDAIIKKFHDGSLLTKLVVVFFALYIYRQYDFLGVHRKK